MLLTKKVSFWGSLILCFSLWHADDVFKQTAFTNSHTYGLWAPRMVNAASLANMEGSVPILESGRYPFLTTHLRNKFNLDGAYAESLIKSVLKHSEVEGVPPYLVFGVINVESQFQHDIKSSAGAMGLMQIVPKWHQAVLAESGYTNQSLLTPDPNIKVGVKILKTYLTLSRGNIDLGLTRYNGSVGEESIYAQKVIRAANTYKRLLAQDEST